MSKRIIGLLLALCLVIGLLPTAALALIDHELSSATVTLFGTAVTVDTDDCNFFDFIFFAFFSPDLFLFSFIFFARMK